MEGETGEDGVTLPGAPAIPGYRLLGVIGHGRMSTVYRAWQESMARVVAVKYLHPELMGDENTVKRFVQEARAVARLSHPGIVKGFDAGRAGGSLYLAMEYVEGSSLARLLQDGAFDEQLALAVATAVAQALDEASRRGIAHRDLKPANILLTPQGRVKVTDFGLARILQPGGSEYRPRTRLDELIGTSDYMAPEQILGRGEVDVRCDLYALGIILYEMLAGRPPFSGTNAEILAAQLGRPVPDVREAAPHVRESVHRLIRKLTAKHPAQRYQSPADLIRELTKIQKNLLSGDREPNGENPMPAGARDPKGRGRGRLGKEMSMSAGDEFGEGQGPPPVPGDDEFTEEESSTFSSLDEIIEGLRPEQSGPRPAAATDARVPPGAEVYLVVVEGYARGRRYRLAPKEKLALGRDGSFCRLVVLDPQVSRLHCSVTLTEDGVKVDDSGSQNGTYIDGVRISSGVLKPGSRLTIGSTALALEVIED